MSRDERRCAQVLQEILSELNIGKFTVKLNHRALLDGIMAIAGVPPEKFRPICSAIDKLDKEEWSEVRREMVVDKGLPEASADAIGEYVALKGAPREMLAKLRDRPALLGNPGAAKALEEMGELFDYLEAMEALGSISFDMSLARGLDYYTGVIYEAVLVAEEGEAGVSVGSVAAGGRCAVQCWVALLRFQGCHPEIRPGYSELLRMFGPNTGAVRLLHRLLRSTGWRPLVA